MVQFIDCTKSGWFDARTFEIWFKKVVLLNAVDGRSLSSPVVLMGDHLPSHFSATVIKECRKHNITFVTMPAIATHLCQPSDVAIFGLV